MVDLPNRPTLSTALTKPVLKEQDSRRICLERRPTCGQVRPMLRYLPAPLARL